MLKREWGAESNGNLPHLFIPSKTATYSRFPSLQWKTCFLGRISALVPEFAVNDLPLDRTLKMKMYYSYGERPSRRVAVRRWMIYDGHI